MSKNRVIYQNWIVELGGEPGQLGGHAGQFSLEEMIEADFDFSAGFEKSADSADIKEAVKSALLKLNEEEREFIIRFHYMGESYKEISKKSGKEIHKLTAMHSRASKKLKTQLKKFAKERFGISSAKENNCVICQSENRAAINKHIKNRDKRKTWRPLIKILRERFNIIIKTPQTLIGHEKYHIN